MAGKGYKFIDLFAGCGGLGEGFYQEGYQALLHLEIDAAACRTLASRMRYYGYGEAEIKEAVLCDDITREGLLEELRRRVHEPVDVIIGGPPCQAFSTVGRAQSPDGMRSDPRNYLFENYLRILNAFGPKMFLFENVKGLLTASPKGVKIFDLIVKKMGENYHIVNDPETLLLNAADYGVPQIRERIIIIGIRKGIRVKPQEVYQRIQKTHFCGGSPAYVTVRDAISDLPKLQAGEGQEAADYPAADGFTKNNAFLDKIRNTKGKLYNHVARKHNDLDRERYRILSEHNWQLKDLQKMRPDLIHHDPRHFGNRYTVQEYDKPGRTVVAHLYKDGNLFIHPDPSQARTFTVREAARIQSFPDDFVFEGSRTDQYKQVGNAVPPFMARAIAKAMREALEEMGDL